MEKEHQETEIWLGGCPDYTYNSEADYTGSMIEVWYDGDIAHVHWDNAASGSSGTSGGSQPGVGGGSGTSSGTSGGQGTNTGDESGSPSKPSGGTESGTGEGSGTGIGGDSNTGSDGGTTSGGNDGGIASLPYTEWEKISDFGDKTKVTKVKRGELIRYNNKMYVSTADKEYSENQWYRDNPENSNNARSLVCIDNSKIVQFYDGAYVEGWNKFQIYMDYGNIYKTKDGRYYLYIGDPCYQNCPEEEANAGQWVQITSP